MSKNPLWCSHPRLSEVDNEGDAICLTCGSVISVVLTEKKLREGMEKLGSRWT